MRIRKNELAFHAMLAPGMVLLLIFSVIPIIGLVIAFQRYSPMAPWWGLASPWVGLDNFRMLLFVHPHALETVRNTIIISVLQIIFMIIVPVTFAVLLNECLSTRFKRSIQTIVYMPHFISWVIVGTIFMQFLSPMGVVNSILLSMGITDEPIRFMTSNTWFRPILVVTNVWRNFGFSAVIYISAITNIDLALYEAAEIDGANRWQRMRFITVPCILPTIVLLSTLALGGILNAGFEQIFNMYSAPVYATGDIIDTFTFRIAIQEMRFHLGTAMGLMKSVVGLILMILAYWAADKFAGYRIF